MVSSEALKKGSLREREITDAVVINTNASNWYETVNYSDDGDDYTLKILIHDPNINLARL